MRQIFYIDPEEEITTVIGRLRKTQAETVVFVIPQRALVLASLINMRLLKRESDKTLKRSVIVTQDEQGLAMAQKAGISAQSALEELNDSNNSISQQVKDDVFPRSADSDSYTSGMRNVSITSPQRIVRSIKPIDSMRMQKPAVSQAHLEQKNALHAQMSQEILLAQNEQKLLPNTPPYKNAFLDRGNAEHFHEGEQEEYTQQHLNTEAQEFESFPKQEERVERPSSVVTNSFFAHSDQVNRKEQNVSLQEKQKRVVKDFFYKKKPSVYREEGPASVIAEKPTRYVIGIFVFLGLFVIGGFFAYVFLPKADIGIVPKTVSKSVDMEFEALADRSEASAEDKVVPLSFFEAVTEKRVSFPATGEGSGSGNQKASGMVTIFNEYSDQSQPLVASTRLVTADGKLFRITKSVVVPGMKQEEGKAVPGKISVEAKADASGAQYNIKPARFSIPGLQGTPKYEKFYAESSDAFSGGGSSGSGSGTVVSSSDVEKAKADVLEKIKEEIAEETMQKFSGTQKIFSEAIQVEVVESVAAPSIGTVAENFEYFVKAKVRSLSFSEKTLRDVAVSSLMRSIQAQEKIQFHAEDIAIDYGKPDVNFEQKTIRIPFRLRTQFVADIQLELVKKEIVGMKETALQGYFKEHPEIDKMDISISPSKFSNDIPRFENRVNVFVKQ